MCIRDRGEDVFCQITAIRKNFAEAKLLSVNKASKYRVTPTCDIYETCGGCQIMHLKYSKQLEFKTDLLQQALKKYAPKGYENYLIRPTLGIDVYKRQALYTPPVTPREFVTPEVGEVTF